MSKNSTRREALQALGLAGLSGLALPGAAHAVKVDAPTPSLNTLAAEKGIIFGSAVGNGRRGLSASLSDPVYQAVLKAECGQLVGENEWKMYGLRTGIDSYDFSRADEIVTFASANNMTVRGHCLLWNSTQWMPQWLNEHDFGPKPAKAAEAFLRDHIKQVVAHYPMIKSWDVVNETVEAETGNLRETVLTKAMGQAVVDQAFYMAREAAPNAQLVYNDYMSWEVGHEKHRMGVLKLLEGFRARKVPVDALGVQSHILSGTASSPKAFDRVQEKQWRQFIDEVVAMGYDLLLTEFDISDEDMPADIKLRDETSAMFTRAYLDLMFSYKQTKALIAWGMMDQYNWLQNWRPRTDGVPKRPTPYDFLGRPKPLRDAIAGALKAAAPR